MLAATTVATASHIKWNSTKTITTMAITTPTLPIRMLTLVIAAAVGTALRVPATMLSQVR